MATKNKLITAANFRDFDWNKAKLFYHIVKCGSFIKAAQLADTDQPSLTRQVQSLEKQVGCPLLIRKPGSGVTLTQKGEELFREVAPFFLRMKGFCGNKYVEINGEKKRKIKIVTTNAVASYILNDLMIEYRKNNPHFVFEINGEDHELDVILNDADISIRLYDPHALDIRQDILFTLEKKLYASEEYLAEYGEPETVEDLKNHLLIVTSSRPEEYPYSDIHWILTLGMPEGKKLQPDFLSNSIECMVNAAQNGLGIIASYDKMSVIRKSKLKNILPNIKEKELKIYFTYPNYLKEDIEIIKIKDYLYYNIS